MAEVLCDMLTFRFLYFASTPPSPHFITHLLTRRWRIKTQLINVGFPTFTTTAHKYSSTSLALLSVFLETIAESGVGKSWSFFLFSSSQLLNILQLAAGAARGRRYLEGRAERVAIELRHTDEIATGYYVWLIQGQEEQAGELKCFRLS